MDNQEGRPVVSDQPTPITTPEPVIGQAQVGTAPQPAKPPLIISDRDAIALLTISNLQTPARPQRKLPIKMIIILIGLVILVLAASSATGFLKSKQAAPLTSPGSTATQQKQSDTNDSEDTNNQVNQDVKSCSDPLNAVTVC